MIKLVRLDERLIHGKVAIKWSRHTGVDRIVVANDEAAGNKMCIRDRTDADPRGTDAQTVEEQTVEHAGCRSHQGRFDAFNRLAVDRVLFFMLFFHRVG